MIPHPRRTPFVKPGAGTKRPHPWPRSQRQPLRAELQAGRLVVLCQVGPPARPPLVRPAQHGNAGRLQDAGRADAVGAPAGQAHAEEALGDMNVSQPETEDDPRLALVYQESLRGLLQQQAAVESLHNRAAMLIFASSFASSLLGSRALADGLGAWDWLAVILLLATGALAVVVLWPYYNLSFRFDAPDLLHTYIYRQTPAT